MFVGAIIRSNADMHNGIDCSNNVAVNKQYICNLKDILLTTIKNDLFFTSFR